MKKEKKKNLVSYVALLNQSPHLFLLSSVQTCDTKLMRDLNGDAHPSSLNHAPPSEQDKENKSISTVWRK